MSKSRTSDEVATVTGTCNGIQSPSFGLIVHEIITEVGFPPRQIDEDLSIYAEVIPIVRMKFK